jgi:hypothetical protein
MSDVHHLKMFIHHKLAIVKIVRFVHHKLAIVKVGKKGKIFVKIKLLPKPIDEPFHP